MKCLTTTFTLTILILTLKVSTLKEFFDSESTSKNVLTVQECLHNIFRPKMCPQKYRKKCTYTHTHTHSFSLNKQRVYTQHIHLAQFKWQFSSPSCSPHVSCSWQIWLKFIVFIWAFKFNTYTTQQWRGKRQKEARGSMKSWLEINHHKSYSGERC